ncbi:MAG: anti-sigma factor [Gammaproteobacteria bacterium]|nr:anti-sigma factor [Gammaproteobacteria bacterium]
MNLRSPSLRQALAAEYVLGNLGPAACRRFEREAAADPALQAEVRRWQQALGCLAPVAAVEPPPEVWARICRDLDGLQRPAGPRAAPPRRRRWRWAAAGMASLATAAALLLAVLPQRRAAELPLHDGGLPADRHAAAQAAWLQLPKESAVRWEISLSPEARMLRVRSVGYPMLDADEDYELWWVGEDDGKMVSIGLLPRDGSWLCSLPRNLQLSTASRLVVTREPAYGSPTDGPTGPVLIHAALPLRS